MSKKKETFKVITTDGDCLKDAFGYYKNLETETVFIYFNKIDRLWYVVDVFTGLAISKGKTMYVAEEEFLNVLEKFRTHKYTYLYLNQIHEYQEQKKKYLLKEGK